MKKDVLTVLVIIVVIIVAFKLIFRKPAVSTPATINQPTTDLNLFYGDTCPHCKNVENFIAQNNIDQKIKIGKYEVYEDKSNATLMATMVKQVCPDKLDSQGLPVPFLIDQKDKTCTTGDTPVIDYLTQKAK
jgi:glutaredoxin